jgi:hypothetical protein
MANWIAGAIKHPGAFTKQAHAAHKSTGAFAAKVNAHPGKFSALTRRRAALARVLKTFNK